APAAHMRARPALAGADAVQAVAGVVHAQRLEDAAGHRFAVEAPGGGEHHVADQAEGDVLVGVALARRAGHRRVRQLLHDAAIADADLDHAVARVVGAADAL